MKKISLLGIEIEANNKHSILEKIKKYLMQPQGNLHIVSLNPENLVTSTENPDFKRTIKTSQIKIIDGFGVVLAGKITGQDFLRFTGVDLMEELLNLASELRLRVLLIGGRTNLADRLAKCYSEIHVQAKIKGIEGIKNIKKPHKSEEDELFSIVADYKPHIVFVAFGSPDQELWIDRHKKQFTGIVCMGVGGAFDFAGDVVPRAPIFVRTIGMEWLFRLLVEPWRWRRQLKLIKFMFLIIFQKYFR